MKQLFITDLDGTLLNSESRVSRRSAEIISRLTARGALITCATARTPATVDILLRDVAMTPPAIVMTGAALWDRRRRAFVEPRFIDAEVAAMIMEECSREAITPLIYTIAPDGIIHCYFHGRPGNKERKFIDERSHLPLKRIHIIERPAVSVSPVYPSTALVFALGDLDRVYALAERLRASGRCSVSAYPDIFNHSLGYIEIFAAGVDKSSAVGRVKELTGAERLTVFGDNLNDLPMMAAADVAVAVDNALPEVKAAADVVIGPNTADSVAEYILEQLCYAN